jgi:ribosomal-protein-alanine N-acetyltransferase
LSYQITFPGQISINYISVEFNQMQVNIRPLTLADQSALWDMLYYGIHVPEGEALPPRSILDQPDLACYAAGWGKAGDIGFLALDGSAPIGAAWLRLLHGYGYVADNIPELSISLIPGYRGLGLGAELMQRLIEAAHAQYQYISLSVSRGNQAKRLYERLGFSVVKEDNENFVMLLSLTLE